MAANDNDALFTALYAQLKQYARRMLAGHGAVHRQPTSLVHEAWIKLGNGAPQAIDQRHFYALAGRAMRQILIDAHRVRRSLRAGAGWRRTDLAETSAVVADTDLDLLGLDQALDRLGALDADLAELVELHYFLGLDYAAIAALRGVHERTARRQWELARAMLLKLLDESVA